MGIVKYWNNNHAILALNDVSFEVLPAELFGLLGPNGSGKTTLFRILSTLMIPTAGRTTIVGFDAAKDPDGLRRQIGVVFQAQSIDAKLTAYENLWHQGHLYGQRGTVLKGRIKEILGRVGLADRSKERVETFSGGMQRRIELAKGLLHHPSVLLLDEPTTGLDPGARRDVWQYLQLLRNQEHVSVMVTTHLMEEAERCDRFFGGPGGQGPGGQGPGGQGAGPGVPGGPDSGAIRERSLGSGVVVDSKGYILTNRHVVEKADRIRVRFNVEVAVLNNKIRLERENGHRFITDVVEAFPGEIHAISVSKPTLEDVFIHRTGHRFWSETGEPAAG